MIYGHWPDKLDFLFLIVTLELLFVLYLIHIDVWGPYKVATHNNMRYFLTLVDDHSRWTWTFLMHLKSDVCTLLKSFLTLIKTQFGRQVKVLRSDNGGEFFNT